MRSQESLIENFQYIHFLFFVQRVGDKLVDEGNFFDQARIKKIFISLSSSNFTFDME